MSEDNNKQTEQAKRQAEQAKRQAEQAKRQAEQAKRQAEQKPQGNPGNSKPDNIAYASRTPARFR